MDNGRVSLFIIRCSCVSLSNNPLSTLHYFEMQFQLKAPIARVIDLVKNYYLESVTVRALRNVSLDFAEGDFVALMGPSGSGKSTLLNMLGCLDRPTTGEYYLGNDNVAYMEDDQLSEVRSRFLGFIFQSYNLLAQYTV